MLKNLLSFVYKVTYASKRIDPGINGFIPKEVIGHFHIFFISIVAFGIRGSCLGFSNTSNVYSLDRFKNQLLIGLQQTYVFKKEIIERKIIWKYNMKMSSFKRIGMGDPTTHDYQFIYNKNDSIDTKIIQYFIMHGLGLCIKVDSYVAHMF